MDLFEKGTPSVAVQSAWAATRDLLLHMQTLCQERSVDFLIVYAPKREQIIGWEDVLRFYKADPDRYDRLLTNGILKVFCEEHHIGFVDITEELAGQPDKASLYYRFDTHLTKKGNQVYWNLLSPKLKPFLTKTD